MFHVPVKACGVMKTISLGAMRTISPFKGQYLRGKYVQKKGDVADLRFEIPKVTR